MDNIAWGRVFYALVVPAAIYATLAWATDAVIFNPLLILVLISISVGVVVAFLPNLTLFFRKDRPLDIFALVVLGISIGWASNVVRPLVPLVIDLFPSMMWLRDTDLVSFGLALTIYSGIVHLIAPSIDKRGKIPSARWARIGIIVGVTVAAGLVALNWPAIHDMFQREEHSEAHPAARPAVFHRDPPPMFPWR